MTSKYRWLISLGGLVVVDLVLWRLWPLMVVAPVQPVLPVKTVMPVITTEYVHAEAWPPQLVTTLGVVTCEPSQANGQTVAWRVIGGREYCVVSTSQGAAGSTYTEYQYATGREDKVDTLTFTLRTVQCLNYDEPKKTACLREQAAFNVDALADTAIQSLR